MRIFVHTNFSVLSSFWRFLPQGGKIFKNGWGHRFLWKISDRLRILKNFLDLLGRT